MRAASEGQIRGLIAAHPPDERRRVLAVRADPSWAGTAEFVAGTRRVTVATASSPLAMREAMLRHPGHEDQVLVVLTSCSGADLGLDVRARLVGGDVLTLDPYGALMAAFGVQVLDPELVAERWLVEELVALAPARGWSERAVMGGVLDADTAWRRWELARLGVESPPVGISELLALAASPVIGRTLSELADAARAAMSHRWAGSRPEPTGMIVDLAAARRGGETGALGLVAGVLWADTDDPALAALQTVARARLEGIFGRGRLDHTSAGEWSSAVVASLVGPNRALTDAAQSYLHGADADDLAVLSDVLPKGFDLRLGRLGRALSAGNLSAGQAALFNIVAHRESARRSHQVTAGQAAMRLLRRGPRQSPPQSFTAAVTEYVVEGSWVETAARSISEGDRVPDLSAAYGTLGAAAAAESADRNTRFAALLGEWSKSESPSSTSLVPVEDILRVVAVPAAKAAPLLVVVCDGMGLAVANDLFDDLRAHGWSQVGPSDLVSWPSGIAALPTVTSVSRTSLLCGRLTEGHQAEEQAGFSAHRQLCDASVAGRPPVLFHKGGLVGPAGTALSDQVHSAVLDPTQRVVGVVVNSVDDHLSRGDQVRVEWGLSALRPLIWLLEAAAEAARLVLITADHGHVLDAGRSRYRPLVSEGGERWRVGPPVAGQDEIEISGPRVLLGGGRVILPTDDHLRYGGSKHGYHGGATPEEVIVPVTVVGRHLPVGWTYLTPNCPLWWSEGDGRPPVEPVSKSRKPATAADIGATAGIVQEQLFEVAAPAAPAAVVAAAGSAMWIDDLLASQFFIAQRARVRLPRPLADERIRRYLTPLGGPGTASTLDALSSATGEAPDVVRLTLNALQRLLNADATEVLAVRADGSVELNRELLAIQFGLAQ